MSGLDKVVERPARCLTGVALSWLLVAASSAGAQPVPLGSAESFAVLARTTVSNTGASAVAGDVGVSLSGTASGFPPGTVDEGSGIHEADAVAVQALLDAAAAFDALGARRCRPANDLTGQDLGGKMLAPGVYCFDGDAPLSGTLTLVGAGPWSFLIGGRLTIDADAQVVAPRIASTCKGSQVVWRVGGTSTSVGASASVIGNVLSRNDIILGAGARLDGRAVALDGGITMANNRIAACSFGGRFPPHTPIKVTGGGQVSVPDPDSGDHRRTGRGRATFAFVAIPGTRGEARGRFLYLNHANRTHVSTFGRMHVFGRVTDIDVVAVDDEGSPMTVRFSGTCQGADCTFSVLVEDKGEGRRDDDDDDDDDDGDDDEDDLAGDDPSRPRDGLGLVVVSSGRIVEARALRPIARGNIQFHEQRDPALTADINDVEFGAGDVMDVSVSLDPGAVSTLADAYLVLELPGGQLLSWTSSGLVPGLIPIARGFVPFPFQGVVTQLVIPRGAPAGRYTWLSALTATGTLNLLTPISESVFTIKP